MGQEIELKLSFPRKALAALRRHPLLAAAAPQGRTKTLDNTYFDTTDLRLKSRRIALRTRRHGRTVLQTVKCASESAGGLTSRPEWEQPFREAFDFSAVDVPKLRKLLERLRPDLAPVFTTRFRRETRLHAPEDGVRILAMIDVGEVLAGDRQEPICELELELVEGQPLDLLLLACRLAADLPLVPCDISKAERGYALHLGEAPVPARPEPSPLTGSETPIDAFRALALACLRQWQANATGASPEGSPEFVHQLRVALRRLRTLITVFAPLLPPAFAEDWKTRLGDNARAFADARDLDVLCDEILSPLVLDDELHSGSEATGVRTLAERVGVDRDRARVEALRAIDPAAQGRQMIGFSAALHALPCDPGENIGLADFARRELDRLLAKVKRRQAAARDCRRTHLHALRIALKRLRYAIEFFSPLLPRKATRNYLDDVVRAQNALGFVHDLDVARIRLAGYAAESPEARAAVAFACGWHGPRYARKGPRAVRDVGKLLARKAPWSPHEV